MKDRHKELKKINNIFSISRLLIATLIAFLISLVIISFSTDEPFKALGSIFVGPFTSIRRFSTVIEGMIPLTFTGLAVCIMFKANQFNLASEGAFFMGALGAAIIAVLVPGNRFIVIPVALIAGSLMGMLITLIPGVLKVKWNVSEMVVSLMLNYICLYFGTYIFNVLIKDPDSAYKASFPFRDGINLSKIIPKTNLHFGLIFMIMTVVFVYFLMEKTAFGYKLRLTGKNINFSKSSGIKVGVIIILAQIFGGLIAGLGGATEMLGMYTRFQWSSLPGFGFDGVVLNILARENPKYIPVAAFFVAFVRIGADYMYKQFGIASEIVAIIEGLIILLVAAEAFMSGWKHRLTTKLSKESLAVEGE